MKRFKKVFAVILSLAMVLGMSLTSFAADHKPVPTDSATITVNGVKAGATVKAFKIAEGQWNDHGFYGYKVVEDAKGDPLYSINDISNPTAVEITTIANTVDRTNGGVTLTDTDGVYTANLEVGSYLILVTANANGDNTIYNPMVTSVYYDTNKSGDTNDQIGGSVSAGDNFEVKGQKAYAKHEVPEIKKEIVDPGSGNVKGDDTAIGDTITFKVTANFPNYSDAYTSAEYNIIDTVSEGLTLDTSSVAIKVGGKDATADDYSVSLSADKRTMTISFTNTENNRYVLDNRGKEVVVTYTAELNEDAGLNYDANTNTVKSEYTNNPTTDGKGETEEKRTYHYTFAINGDLNGSGSYKTGELFKTDENDDGTLVEGAEIKTPNHPLDGAEFTLTRIKDNKGNAITNGKSYTAISGTNADGTKRPGTLNFEGLDDGTYTLVETKAPSGYSLNDKEHTVVISAEYAEDGKLVKYTIKVDGKDVTGAESFYKAEYQADDSGKIVAVIDHTKEESTLIQNTKMASLPSTGGIGTTIFTIGGCAIMIIAAGLFFASRRKSTNAK